MGKRFYTATLNVTARESGMRIDHFLSRNISQEDEELKNLLSRSKIQKYINNGNILVNEMIVKQSYTTREGDLISLHLPLERRRTRLVSEKIYFEVVYYDRDIMVVNKPAGLVVHPAYGHPGHTLLNGLLYLVPELKEKKNLTRMGIVHRLDKDTSGLLVLTLNEMARYEMVEQFKKRSIKKEYIGIIKGKPEHPEGQIHTKIGRNPMHRKRMTVLITGGKESITRYRVLKRYPRFTFVSLVPHTGRTHQLRVHMSYINHPVMGDPIYARRRTSQSQLGLMLHARRLKFAHPRTGREMEFLTGIPERFQILLNRGEMSYVRK